MNRKALFFLMFPLATIYLVACGPSRAEMDDQATQTAFALAATHRQSYAETETARPTFTATITSTPTTTPTSIFPTPVDYHPGSMVTTLTPISTPISSENNYTLKDWTQNDALHLIQAMDEYAYKSDFLVGSSRGQFEFAQYPVRLSIFEALYRFPDFWYKHEIEWRLALSDAIQMNDNSNAWIAAQIETALNEGGYGVEDLESMLLTYGFELVQSIVTENLFSDNQEAVVIQIMPINSWNDGQFMAIRNKTDGLIDVEIIFTSWNYGYGNHTFTVDDHNRNGVPEVILETHIQSGSMCSAILLMYEWRQSRFEELTKGEVHSSECYYEWDFIDEDSGDAQLIEFEMLDIPLYSSHALFTWDGRYYQLSEREIDPPYMLAFLSMLNGDYAQARDLIEETLNNLPEDYIEEIGPAFPDFLRFQLGMIAALQEDYEEATASFKSLAEEPSDPEYPAISYASQTFLNSYKQSSDVYQSCKAARAYLDEIIAGVPGKEGLYDDSPERKVWGYDAWRLYWYQHICDLDSAFRMFVEDFIIVEGNDLIDQLSTLGVIIRHSIPITLSTDGIQDYIMLIETVDSWHPCDRGRLWVLRSLDQGYEAFQGDCIWDPDSPGEIDSTVITIPGDERTGVILQEDDSLYVIVLTNEECVSASMILDDIDVESYDVLNTDTILEIQVNNLPSTYRPSAGGTYNWNEELGKFIYSDRIEDEIFANNNPAAAIPLLERILDYLLEEERQGSSYYHRYLYLLGLAYEFNREDVAASDVYWRLWHDFPESQYGVMASYKLELLSQ